MLASVLIAVAVFTSAAVLLLLKWVLGIVREAFGEIARDEIKAAIPQLSFGLVRRAARDLPEPERAIVEEWEHRLRELGARPLLMLMLALNIYRERRALALELRAELVPAIAPGHATGKTARRVPAAALRVSELLSASLATVRPHLKLLAKAFLVLASALAVAGWAAFLATVERISMATQAGGTLLVALLVAVTAWILRP